MIMALWNNRDAFVVCLNRKPRTVEAFEVLSQLCRLLLNQTG